MGAERREGCGDGAAARLGNAGVSGRLLQPNCSSGQPYGFSAFYFCCFIQCVCLYLFNLTRSFSFLIGKENCLLFFFFLLLKSSKTSSTAHQRSYAGQHTLPVFLRGVLERMNGFGSSYTCEIFLVKETECGLAQEKDEP